MSGINFYWAQCKPGTRKRYAHDNNSKGPRPGTELPNVTQVHTTQVSGVCLWHTPAGSMTRSPGIVHKQQGIFEEGKTQKAAIDYYYPSKKSRNQT